MKNLWKDDLSLKEWNEELKKALKRLDKQRCNKCLLVLSFVAIAAFFGVLAVILIKRRQDKLDAAEFDDDCDCGEEADENGCRYTDEEDFE